MKRICIWCRNKFKEIRIPKKDYNRKYGICSICREKILKDIKKK